MPPFSDFESDLIVQARQIKDNFKKEQSLPPAKPAFLFPRDMLAYKLNTDRWHTENEMSKGDQHWFKHCWIGMPQKYSSIPLNKLRPILIKDLLVRKHHEGRFVLCRIISKPIRKVAIMLAVEDIQGTAVLLSVNNFPILTNASWEELDSIWPVGTCLAIREPSFKLGSAGGEPMIRVDSPTDIVFLRHDSELLRKAVWRYGSALPGQLGAPSTAEEWRARGFREFKAQRFLAAAVCFSEGLAKDPSAHILRLNRAQTYLRLDWNSAAAADASIVLEDKQSLNDDLLRKCIYRLAKAHHECGKYEAAMSVLERFKDDAEFAQLCLEASKRLDEQKTGVYDWCSLLCTASKISCPRLDLAEYTGAIDVKECESGKRGRGVFVTRDVKVGELLMVAKPIASAYEEERRTFGYLMAYNMLTDRVNTHAQATLVHKVVENMWSDRHAASTIKWLYSGEDTKYASQLPSPDQESAPLSLEHPVRCPRDIDIAEVQAVCSFNAFSIQFPDKTYDGKKYSGSALYGLPSICNHSCLPSAHRMFLGDAMVIRASANLSKGDEVTLQYVPGDGELQDRENALQGWRFICDCVLCQADRTDGKDARDRRKQAYEDLIKHLKQGNMKQAERDLTQIASTYKDSSQRKLCNMKPTLAWAHHNYASALLSLPTLPTSALLKSLRHQIIALEALGCRVIDKSLSGAPKNEDSQSSGLPIDGEFAPRLMDRTAILIMVSMAKTFLIQCDYKRATKWFRTAAHAENLLHGGGHEMFKTLWREKFDEISRTYIGGMTFG